MPASKHRLLERLAGFITGNPRFILAVSLLTALVSLAYTATHLKFDTNQDNLISNKLPYHQRYQRFLAEFGDLEYVFVVFEAAGREKEAKEALHALAERLQGMPERFTEVKYREDLNVLKNRGLLLLPPDEFESLIQKLTLWSPELNRLAGTRDFAGLFDFAAEKLELPPKTLKRNAKDLESGFEILKTLLEGLSRPEKIAALTQADLFKPLIGKKFYQDPEGYFFSQDGSLLILALMPVKDYATSAVIEAPLKALRSEMDAIRRQFPDVPMGATGRPVLQADEMASTGSDSVWAGLASLLGVLLLYVVYFKQAKRPALAIASLLCGMAWTIGWVTLTLGHLNLLTVVFAVILIGLGIDYGIHLLIRYLHERALGLSVAEALHRSLANSGGAIITGALTTAAAFLTSLFTDFLGLQELGFVAGSGVLFCLVSQIVTYPACLALFDKKGARRIDLPSNGFKGLDFVLERPHRIWPAVLALTLASLPMLWKVGFENNLLNLQDPGLESVKYELKLLDSSNLSTWVAAYMAPSREQLAAVQAKVQKLSSVGWTESLYTLVPPDQLERVRRLRELKGRLALERSPSGPLDADSLAQSLSRLKLALEDLQGLALGGGREGAVEELDALITSAGNAQERLRSGDAAYAARLKQSQDAFFTFLGTVFSDLKSNLEAHPLSESELPASLMSRYRSEAGNYVLYAYPAKNIWQPDFMERFISELRGVDPEVTGSPIGVYESALRMKNGFYLVGALTLILVGAFLYLDFRSAKDCLIAATPLLSGFLWLIAWMGLLGLHLNLANFFAMPILIGLAIDNGVHLVHRFRETGSAREMLHQVIPAITLSTLTTVIGFGALSFVRHRGLASFGQIMAIGSVTCWAASILIVPLMIRLLYGDLSKR